jgi:hypothetical protein
MVSSQKYISGEQHKALQTKGDSKKQSDYQQYLSRPALLIGITLFVIVVSFISGMQYEKGRKTTQTASTSGNASQNGNTGSQFGGSTGSMGRRFGGVRPTIGTVTTISSSSITLNNTRTGADTTLTITSSTTVTNNGQAASVSDIKTGDTVFVRTDTTNTKQAAQIDINPSLPSSSAPQSDSSSGTTDLQTN